MGLEWRKVQRADSDFSGNVTGKIDNVAVATIKSGAAAGATANQDSTATILGGTFTGDIGGVTAANISQGATRANNSIDSSGNVTANVTGNINGTAASTVVSGAASGATANQDSTSTILAGTLTGTVGANATIGDTTASTVVSGAASGATANQDSTSTILAGTLTGTVAADATIGSTTASTVTSGAALGATANQDSTATILGGTLTGTVSSDATIGSTTASTVISGAAAGATANQDSTSTILAGTLTGAVANTATVGGTAASTVASGAANGTTAIGAFDTSGSTPILNVDNAAAGLKNSGITINSDGTLSGAGSGQVTAAGVNAIGTDGTGAPNSLKNNQITLTASGGTVTLNNAGSGTIDKGDIGLGSVVNQAITVSSGRIQFDGTNQTIDAQSLGGSNLATVKSDAVSTAETNILGGAPDALNTLDELAAALNDDASFNSTITNSIATKGPAPLTLAEEDVDGDSTFSSSANNPANLTEGQTGFYNGDQYVVVNV